MCATHRNNMRKKAQECGTGPSLTVVSPVCDSPHMSDPAHTSDLLTGAQVAELYRINRSTLSRWQAKGLITPVRNGVRHVRYRRDDIDRLLAFEEQPAALLAEEDA